MTADNFASILGAIAWPATVFVLALIFKNDISELLKRIQKAKFPGGEATFEYGEAAIDRRGEQPSLEPKAEPVAKPKRPTASAIKWNNSGNLFWLGHDLVWTIDVLLRGGPRDRIVHGLRQSLHHVRSLGLADNAIESRLARLKANAESSLQQDWTQGQRNSYTGELASLIGDIGKLAEANQSDFDPNPKE